MYYSLEVERVITQIECCWPKMRVGNFEIKPLQIGIIVLTILTALIHVSLAEPLFILNGLGYLVLLVLYFLPHDAVQRRHRWIRWVFAGYIILTIILYFVSHPNGAWQDDGLGVATKVVEVILLLLVILDGQGSLLQDNGSS